MSAFAAKVTLLVNDLKGGWSETYFLSPPGGTTLASMVEQLVLARVKVLGKGCVVVLARAGMTNVPRSMKKYKYSLQGQAADIVGNEKGTNRYADQRDTTVLMPYRTAAGTLRYVNLSGFPDGWVDREPDGLLMRINDAGIASLNVFYDFLLTTPFALNIRERVRTGGNAPVDVTDITQHTDGKYRIVSTLAASLASGDKVVITGAKGSNLANTKGTRKVADVIDGTHFTIDRGPRADLGVPDLTVNAKVAKVGYSYEVAQNTDEAYDLTTRQRGRSFSQRRGRRSASK